MAKPHLGLLERFNTIGNDEAENVLDSLRGGVLSGYIGGNSKGGYWVERLAAEWKAAFDVGHAIPCNSATSGLMAACMAVDIGPLDVVLTTAYSMSATAACAKVLGAEVRFLDIELGCFGLDPAALNGWGGPPKAVIVTNLFGHPARLREIKAWCDRHGVWMIEDNAQSPFAEENGRYTGTVGHIGVFSLNVHKHIQCGEGGVIVTNSGVLANNLYDAINHGELGKGQTIGLNLRMTEPIAAIACAQLAKAGGIIEGRRQIGLALSDMVKDVPWITAHVDQPRCKHVYYLWTALIDTPIRCIDLVIRLNAHGVPIRARYAPLLHKLFDSGDSCPVVEDVDSRIIVFEVCAYGLKDHHLKTMREIIKRVTGEMK